jgi:hypothetical protein
MEPLTLGVELCCEPRPEAQPKTSADKNIIRMKNLEMQDFIKALQKWLRPVTVRSEIQNHRRK